MKLLNKAYCSYPVIIGLLLVASSSVAQTTNSSIAEQLGYSSDARLLIIHADDLGVNHSTNDASISAWENNGINSASIMVPTHWFPEIAHYANKNPEFDLGLHLTLTAEWSFYKWNGVLPSNEIPSLLTDKDYFYPSVAEVVQNANPNEVEKELRAQIERAIGFGLKPTHLDSHMGTLFAHPAFFESYLNLGKEYQIPVLVPYGSIMESPESELRDRFLELVEDYPVKVKEIVQLTPQVPASDWFEAYDEAIRNLKPGLNELIVHTAYDDAEMQAMAVNAHHSWDSEWRQRDYDYVVSQRFKDLLEEENIQLVTWREIQKLMYPD